MRGGDYLADISRDGTLIAYCADLGQNRTEIFLMHADGSGKHRVTNADGGNFNPGISPDGRQIVFHSMRDRENGAINRELYLINSDGTGERRLTTHPAQDRNPAFSPDGKKIIFQSDRNEEMPGSNDNWEIYTINLDGGELTRLTHHPAADSDPAYSPDGTRIAFVSNRDFNPEIYVMDADGGNVIRLTHNLGDDNHPAFSPDGKQLVFHSNRDRGSQELYLINVDGTGEKRLTTNLWYDWFPVWGRR